MEEIAPSKTMNEVSHSMSMLMSAAGAALDDDDDSMSASRASSKANSLASLRPDGSTFQEHKIYMVIII